MQAIGEIGGHHDVAAVNHWNIAIETHKRNHPDTRSYCMSLEQLDPLSVFGSGEKIDLLWASPECTHHSNARGGRPRSNQSRASAWLIMKWLSELYIRRIIIENVPEFISWGPLGANGKPMPSGRGKLFDTFVNGLKALGYRVDHRLLCAADYGDPTTRTRFFLQAVRGHGRIVWPEPSHAQDPGLFGRAQWKAAREIIDWNIHGTSIWNRKTPLADATMRRIQAGIKRYWGEWAEPFLVRFNSGDGRVHSLDEPLPVQDCSNRYGLVQPFILHQDAPGRPRLLDEPVPTIRGRNGHGLVEPFIVHYYGNGDAVPTRIPLATVTTKDRFALVEGKAGLDITLRMLHPRELAAAQGFPSGYDFAGTKTDQVKQIGNAVPVGLARALALEALSA
jgi:DNA (cytosine-5)-methyltransferase 1